MGHRASVGYLKDGRVRAHYSHWGAIEFRLAFDDEYRISPQSPFGGGSLEPEVLDDIRTLIAGDQNHSAAQMFREEFDHPVEVDPYELYESVGEWANSGVDKLHHEAAYLVDVADGYSVRAFDTVWNRPDIDDAGEWDTVCGLLVECYAADEWNDYTRIPEEEAWVDGLSPTEFEGRIRDVAGSRVPDWSHALAEEDR